MCEFTFPSGLIYIGIVIVMVIVITVLAMVNANQKHELEYLRSRRSIGKKSEAAGKEAEKPEPQVYNSCGIICSYRDIEIPRLKQKIEYLNEELKSAATRCEIMQSTITKLRTGRGSEDVQND